ncbi:hypothetical protein BHC48_05895 [Snodgrassella communis]|uniref:Uncharacterized protein n=1 Tax=Snodgrassella alvi TaxID=1196083 RepID=A0A2N9XQN1_9NEIS|nr:hypothetical protein BHC48_05985 [Snodgrassella communis]PIT50636.1 hypothetical protein BHC48_05955 [Snodgrassella communis]PIT50644.1 hypothetical protein BHC48_05930 [Snodgrassella communis]PIT50651.1 hypothetical protein BHC48_05895 [Snodgrassella communis]
MSDQIFLYLFGMQNLAFSFYVLSKSNFSQKLKDVFGGLSLGTFITLSLFFLMQVVLIFLKF